MNTVEKKKIEIFIYVSASPSNKTYLSISFINADNQEDACQLALQNFKTDLLNNDLLIMEQPNHESDTSPIFRAEINLNIEDTISKIYNEFAPLRTKNVSVYPGPSLSTRFKVDQMSSCSNFLTNDLANFLVSCHTLNNMGRSY